MERELSRVHKLASPLILKRDGSTLTISDGVFKHSLDFKEFGKITIIGSDSEGFITFEISKPQQPSTLIDFSQTKQVSRRVSTGFSLIGKGIPKSLGSTSGATYEYFKRTPDETYYAKITVGTKSKKIHLGSLQDQSSSFYKIVKAAQRFGDTQWFDRKMLRKYLIPADSHGQKLKSTLDILIMEGYLERQESQKRGKPYEQYKKTSKIEAIH